MILSRFAYCSPILIFISAVAVFALEKMAIPSLAKSAKQPIYSGGPSWHLQKSGTPTMGGLCFFPIFLLILPFLIVLTNKNEAVSVLFAILYALLNGCVGLIDDFTKLKKKQNAGLSPIQKLLLQGGITVLYVLAERKNALVGRSVFDLVVLFFVLLFFVNSVNLTDGVDGLCAGTSYGVGCALLCFSVFLKTSGGVLLACLLIGTCLGFLCFNLHPAKIFMGDTGSLFLGGLLAASFVLLNRPFFMLSCGGVFVLEGVSVLLQVGFYKLTHKRIFRMAPLHHHFEKCGWSENRICLVSLGVTILLSGVSAFLLL